MNAEKQLSAAKHVVIFTLIIFAFACSKKKENTPLPLQTQADLLVQGGKWFTTGAILQTADGTSVTLAADDPFLKTILLYNVTFYANGTAIDTNNPNGLTKNGLTWTLNNAHLLVRPNFNNTDKVDATITLLSSEKLIMNVTDFYSYNNVTYTKLIQTLTH
jgi:hypothetical protein